MENKIKLHGRDGLYSFTAKHDQDFYIKNGLLFPKHSIFEIYGVPEARIRYINFSDQTGYVLSCNRPRSLPCNPSWLFDHVTHWTTAGDRRKVLFSLAEPYGCPPTEDIRKNLPEHFSFYLMPPSEKSLWYPNASNMIFIWKNQFEFDKERMFCHEDWKQLKTKIYFTKSEKKRQLCTGVRV